MPAMQRFGLGLLCLTIYAIFSPHLSDSYFLTDEYGVRGVITVTFLCSHDIALDLFLFCSLFIVVFILKPAFYVFFPGPAFLVSLCVHHAVGQSYSL